MEKGRKEAMDLIMMEEDQIKQIMETIGKMRNAAPCQYNMNNKKISIAERESLASDEEEVEDLHVVD
jgi:hypothetical protein